MKLTSYRNLSALVTCHTLYVVFDLAECCVFVKQSVDPVTETSLRRHPLFLSYGVRLPSSLTRFHSYAFALLRDPTCVGLVRTPDYTPPFSCGAPHDNFAPFDGNSPSRDRHSTACLHLRTKDGLNIGGPGILAWLPSL